jgi:hypothetical protein
VAVVTRAEGFTTLAGLVPAFAFHAVTSVGGLQLLQAAKKREPVVVADAA